MKIDRLLFGDLEIMSIFAAEKYILWQEKRSHEKRHCEDSSPQSRKNGYDDIGFHHI